jgi:hypothetical protein
MPRFNLKRSTGKPITSKSRVIKKTHKKIERRISQESKIKIKEISDSMRDDSAKLNSLEDMIKEKFGDLTKIESHVMESLIFKIYIKELEEKLASAGDDGQLANIDLQNALQKQQQTLQTMSNVSKMMHDTAMAVIRKIG